MALDIYIKENTKLEHTNFQINLTMYLYLLKISEEFSEFKFLNFTPDFYGEYLYNKKNIDTLVNNFTWLYSNVDKVKLKVHTPEQLLDDSNNVVIQNFNEGKLKKFLMNLIAIFQNVKEKNLELVILGD